MKILLALSLLLMIGCTQMGGVAKYQYSVCEDDRCTEVVLKNSKNIGELNAEIVFPSGLKISLTEKNVDAATPLAESTKANAQAIELLGRLLP